MNVIRTVLKEVLKKTTKEQSQSDLIFVESGLNYLGGLLLKGYWVYKMKIGLY